MSIRRVMYEINDDTGEAREINTEFVRRTYARNACDPSDRFIWAAYDIGTVWLADVPRADVARMVFLATHLSYSGYLVHGNNRALQKSGVCSLVGLSVSKFYGFWKTMIQSHLFYEKDGKIYADRKVFRKGNLRPATVGKHAERGVYFTRLYADAIRQLYHAVPASSVRVASYIFQVMPFVNREFNIVCHNPLETDLEKIQPLKLSEFCELVGYNKRGSRRLLGQLAGIRITVDGEEQPAVSYEKYPAGKLTYGIFINPNIYYAGSDILAVELMGAFRRRDRIPERKEG